MLDLQEHNIQLGQQASDKQQAIRQLAASLQQSGNVAAGYVEGMLAREAQTSTYLGSGIAIPHGTTDTRDQVKQTGVSVHHFAEGVDWGDGNTVYLAVGIAAKSDEHLAILKQLTRVLSADGVEQALKQADSTNAVLALLNGETQLAIDFNQQLVLDNLPISDALQARVLAAGLLKNHGLVTGAAVSEAASAQQSYLGEGVWLSQLQSSARKSALAVIRPDTAIDADSPQPMRVLLSLAIANRSCDALLEQLAELCFNGDLAQLHQLAPQALVETLLGQEGLAEESPAADTADGNTQVFQIRNAHGLHARPGALLVAEAKKFTSKISVSNLDGEGKAVNAKSLMKVMTLGVKAQHRLQFTADGPDAQDALAAIGAAIDSGLGEG
ncbi:fused PTS fructose transporter subunit IIA/HPr protein [Aliagarivorans taiwanensis]|uniref:fused PTS fructose transporter subunit IIA/HPr protein n=1 Tax=Aliagarivorans taiwanensis TaxID=561966 RepID=UPI0003FB0370|nr:fused PTS fructose transporter subunit IIA/HPr protein [Aliagarivorans taiwanensis]